MRTAKRAGTRKRAVTDSYFALVRRFPLRRIRDQAEHAEAMSIITDLMRRGDDKLDSGEGEYLETLAQLISNWELERLTWRRPTPLEALRHLMEAHGMTSGDLARLIGSSSAASMILREERAMSKTHIRKLADHFGVKADLFP